MKTIREQINVDGSAMNLFSAQPDSSGPLAAVVVIQHQYGVDKFMEEMTERFARDGYFAVCPDLYHRDGPDCRDDGPTRRGRARDSNIINDINRAAGRGGLGAEIGGAGGGVYREISFGGERAKRGPVRCADLGFAFDPVQPRAAINLESQGAAGFGLDRQADGIVLGMEYQGNRAHHENLDGKFHKNLSVLLTGKVPRL